MNLSVALSRLAALSADTSESGRVRYAEILEIIGRNPTGIVERLAATLRFEHSYQISSSVTDVNFPTAAEPSLAGARVDVRDGHYLVQTVAQDLARERRRFAYTAELLLYGTQNPQDPRRLIWALGQTSVPLGENRQCAVVLHTCHDGQREAVLYAVPDCVAHGQAVLSFPMTAAEIAAARC